MLILEVMESVYLPHIYNDEEDIDQLLSANKVNQTLKLVLLNQDLSTLK